MVVGSLVRAAELGSVVRIPPIKHSTSDQGKPTGGLTLLRVNIEPRATREGGCLHPFAVRSAGGSDDIDGFDEPRIGRGRHVARPRVDDIAHHRSAHSGV